MASFLDLFDLKSRVESLQLSCCLKGNDCAGVPNDKQDRHLNRTHQLVILGVGRRENIKRTHSRLQSRLGQDLDDLGRAMRMSSPCLSQHLGPVETEDSAVLLGDVAVANLALPLWAYERRVHQDDPASDFGELTRYHGRCHASHRVPQQDRSGKSEPPDESDDVARVVLVTIPVERRARTAVPPGIWHHHVVFTLESAGQRSPARAAPHQSVKQNNRWLGSSGSQIVDVDTIYLAMSGRHRNRSGRSRANAAAACRGGSQSSRRAATGRQPLPLAPPRAAAPR